MPHIKNAPDSTREGHNHRIHKECGLQVRSFGSSNGQAHRELKLFTDHVRSTREGNVFTDVCDSVQGGEGHKVG